jgi:hypothetical protein
VQGGVRDRRTLGLADDRCALRYHASGLAARGAASASGRSRDREPGLCPASQPRGYRPTTLFYFDPPYYGSEKGYGTALFTRAEFDSLADLLRGLQCWFILGVND